MHRRRLLITCIAAATGLLQTHHLEAAAMKDFLHYDRLDGDRFPDLRPHPDAFAINGRILRPPGDARLPESARRPMLLLVFRLEQPPLPNEAAPQAPAWMLGIDRADANGQMRRTNIALVERPKDDYDQRPRRDPNRPLLPGTVYLGALAADLGELFAAGVLRSGTVVEVSFHRQSTVRLTVP
jgi:hypothetical protein